MNGLLVNIVLAIVWVMVTGIFSFGNLFVGFGLGYAILALTQGISGRPRYARKLLSTARFIGFFMYELALANIKLAINVLLTRERIRPAIIAVPLEVTSDFEITTLANLITLTPGSTAIDVSADRKTLFVHVVDIGDSDISEVVAAIKRGIERRLVDVMR